MCKVNVDNDIEEMEPELESDLTTDDSMESQSSDSSESGEGEEEEEVILIPVAGESTSGTGAEANDEAEEEEDEVVKAIKKEQMNIRELPRDIVFNDYVVQISFHPLEHMVALASVSGDVTLYKYADDTDAELVRTMELHTRACRAIEFSSDGTLLFSASKDKSMMVSDVHTGNLRQAYDDAHTFPLYCMCVINANQVATADDGGTVKLWDLRQQRELFALSDTDNYVSSMITTGAERHLACTSGDGFVSVINMSARKHHANSEYYEMDLNCSAVCRNDSKLVVGTSDGKMLMFNWGQFGYHSDLFPGPKHGINRLIAATDHIVLSACDDGNIRATYLFPHRQLGVIGQHKYPVESMDISSDGRLIASCSHDHTVKFWNISYLEDVSVNAREKADKTKLVHNLPSSKVKDRADFFQGLGGAGAEG